MTEELNRTGIPVVFIPPLTNGAQGTSGKAVTGHDRSTQCNLKYKCAILVNKQKTNTNLDEF